MEPPRRTDVRGKILSGLLSPVGLPGAFAGSAAMEHNTKRWKLFSPPRVTAAAAAASQGEWEVTIPPSFDLSTGWDFFVPEDRKLFWTVVHEQQPDVIGMSPERRPFSNLMNPNWSRMDPQHAREIQKKGIAKLSFCIEVAEYQLSRGTWFYTVLHRATLRRLQLEDAFHAIASETAGSFSDFL